ncbi:MAG TPA: hypothetical protein VK673_10780 [Chthoniobacterales bacterium]|nr:hypothetical protein [Chthoniobacterales bacterium]
MKLFLKKCAWYRPNVLFRPTVPGLISLESGVEDSALGIGVHEVAFLNSS